MWGAREMDRIRGSERTAEGAAEGERRALLIVSVLQVLPPRLLLLLLLRLLRRRPVDAALPVGAILARRLARRGARGAASDLDNGQALASVQPELCETKLACGRVDAARTARQRALRGTRGQGEGGGAWRAAVAAEWRGQQSPLRRPQQQRTPGLTGVQVPLTANLWESALHLSQDAGLPCWQTSQSGSVHGPANRQRRTRPGKGQRRMAGGRASAVCAGSSKRRISRLASRGSLTARPVVPGVPHRAHRAQAGAVAGGAIGGARRARAVGRSVDWNAGLAAVVLPLTLQALGGLLRVARQAAHAGCGRLAAGAGAVGGQRVAQPALRAFRAVALLAATALVGIKVLVRPARRLAGKELRRGRARGACERVGGGRGRRSTERKRQM